MNDKLKNSDLDHNYDFHPKQIRINQDDGDIDNNEHSALWLKKLSTFVSQNVGKKPNIRIGAYHHGSATFFAIDVFPEDNSEGMSITIGLSTNLLLLPNQFDSHLDLGLPGIIDTLKVLSVIKEATNGQLTITSCLHRSDLETLSECQPN